MIKRILLAFGFFSVLGLAACSDDYPLVANGYSKTVDLSALDNQGRGNFAEPVEPKGCLLAFQAMPDLTTMQVRVVMEPEVDRTFSSAELMRALNGADFTKGIFVVDETGVRFQKGYDCDSEVKE